MMLYTITGNLRLLIAVLFSCFLMQRGWCMEIEEEKKEELQVESLSEVETEEGTVKKVSIPDHSPLYNLKGTYNVVADQRSHLALTNGAVLWHTGFLRRLYHFGDLPRGELNGTPLYNKKGGSGLVRVVHALFGVLPKTGPEADLMLSSCVQNWTSPNIIMTALAEILCALNTINVKEIKKIVGSDFAPCVTAMKKIVSQAPSIKLDAEKKEKEKEEEKDKNAALWLMQAFLESAPHNPDALYPPHTLEMVFVAFAYKMFGHNKELVKQFYKTLNKKLNHTFIVLPRSKYMLSRFKTAAYEKMVRMLASKNGDMLKKLTSLPNGWKDDSFSAIAPRTAGKAVNSLLGAGRPDLRFEEIVFSAFHAQGYPQLVGNQIEHLMIEAAKKNEAKPQTDCAPMDNAVRNLIRLLAYDPAQGVCTVAQLHKRKFTVDKTLEEFLQDYPAPQDDDTPAAQTAWLEVTANRNYIFYQYEKNEKNVKAPAGDAKVFVQAPEDVKAVAFHNELKTNEKDFALIKKNGFMLHGNLRNMMVMLHRLLGIDIGLGNRGFNNFFINNMFLTNGMSAAGKILGCTITSMLPEDENSTVDAADFNEKITITTRFYFKDRFEFVLRTNNSGVCTCFVKDVALEKITFDSDKLDLKSVPTMSLLATYLYNRDAINNIAFVPESDLYGCLFALPLEDTGQLGKLIIALGKRGKLGNHEEKVIGLLEGHIKRHPDQEMQKTWGGHLAKMMVTMKRDEGVEKGVEALTVRDNKIVELARKAIESGPPHREKLGYVALTGLVKHGKRFGEACNFVNQFAVTNQGNFKKHPMLAEAIVDMINALIDKKATAGIDIETMLTLFMNNYDELAKNVLLSLKGNENALAQIIEGAAKEFKQENAKRFAAAKKIIQAIVEQGDAKSVSIGLAHHWLTIDQQAPIDVICKVVAARLEGEIEKGDDAEIWDILVKSFETMNQLLFEESFNALKAVIKNITKFGEEYQEKFLKYAAKQITISFSSQHSNEKKWAYEVVKAFIAVQKAFYITPETTQKIGDYVRTTVDSLTGDSVELTIYRHHVDEDVKVTEETMKKILNSLVARPLAPTIPLKDLVGDALRNEWERLDLLQKLVAKGIGYQEAAAAAGAAYDNQDLREKAVAILRLLSQKNQILLIAPEVAQKLVGNHTTKAFAHTILKAHIENKSPALKNVRPAVMSGVFEIKDENDSSYFKNLLEIERGDVIPLSRGKELLSGEEKEGKELGAQIIGAHVGAGKEVKDVPVGVGVALLDQPKHYLAALEILNEHSQDLKITENVIKKVQKIYQESFSDEELLLSAAQNGVEEVRNFAQNLSEHGDNYLWNKILNLKN